MTALAKLDDILIAQSTAGRSEHITFFKDGRQGATVVATPTQGRWYDMWTYNGFPGGQGSTPGASARYPTNTTAGAMGQVDPSGGRQKWLLGGIALAGVENGSNNVAGKIMFYDRLADYSGLSGTSVVAQTVNLNALTRYTSSADCVGNMIAVWVDTAVGATQRSITASYTNQAGTSGRTTQAVPFGGTGYREVSFMQLLPLQSGDTGVQSVQSVTLSNSTGTAGSFGVMVIHHLLDIHMTAVGTAMIRDRNQQVEGVAEILPGACISSAWFSVVAGTVQSVFGMLKMVEN